LRDGVGGPDGDGDGSGEPVEMPLDRLASLGGGGFVKPGGVGARVDDVALGGDAVGIGLVPVGVQLGEGEDGNSIPFLERCEIDPGGENGTVLGGGGGVATMEMGFFGGSDGDDLLLFFCR